MLVEGKYCKSILSAFGALVFLTGCGEHPDDKPGAVNNPHPEVLISAESQITFDPVDTRMVYSVPVTLSLAAPEGGSLRFRTVAGTAVADRDYTATEESVTFEAGQRQVNLPIELINDAQRSTERSFHIELVRATNAILTEEVVHQITLTANNISGDPERWPTLNLPSGLVYHEPTGPRDYNIIVPLSEVMPAHGSIHVELIEQSAQEGIDFTGYAGVIEIPRFSTELLIPVTLLNNPAPTTEQNFRVELSQAQGVNLGSERSFEVAIVDTLRAAPYPQLQLSPELWHVPTLTSNAVSSVVTLYFQLSDTLSDNASVQVRSRNGSAMGGIDFEAIASRIHLNSGVTELAVELTRLPRAQIVPSREFELVFSDAQGLNLPEVRSVTVQLDPHDTARVPELSVASDPIVLFAPQTGTAAERLIVLSFSNQAPLHGQVRIRAQDQTAVQGVHFELANDIHRFALGAQEVLIELEVEPITGSLTFELIVESATNLELPSDPEERKILVEIRGS